MGVAPREAKQVPGGDALPAGTVTFLFTDIEGSTRLWQEHRDVMPAVIAAQNALLREAVEAEGGTVFKMAGDAVYAAFESAPAALSAALEGQRALMRAPWPEGIELRVRMALHAGQADVQEGEYVSHTLNRVARLLSAGNGGQVLVSLPAAELLRDFLPNGVELRDLGERQLKDLLRTERIFEVVAPGLPQHAAPLKTLDARSSNLPEETTPFVGRKHDLEEIGRLIRGGVRLLTLTGVGGTGKTRLALAAAARLRDELEDGVRLVSLAALTDPDLVVGTIASTLGVKESGDQGLLDQVIAVLQAKQLLLVLDNCEQVLPGVAVASDLLAACSRLVVVATSRSRLHLAAEYEYPVAPMQLPTSLSNADGDPNLTDIGAFDAVALFVERAQASRHGFTLTPENAAAVVDICRRLDGLPLALELAAARLRLFPPQVLATRLSRRLDVLRGGPRDAPSRQQTLRGAIDWSFDLLGAEERALFARLSVFSGGFSVEAAHSVAGEFDDNGDVLDGVESLIDMSLLGTAGDAGRIVMLETLREYGLERLAERGEMDAVRQAHAAFFVAFAEASRAGLRGPDQARYIFSLNSEIDNLRTALQYCLDARDVDLGLRLAGALWLFWEMHGYLSEGRSRLDALLRASVDNHRSAGPAQDSTRAAALVGAAALAMDQSDYGPAREQAMEALELYRGLADDAGAALALNVLGSVAGYTGEYEAAERQTEEGLRLFRERGDRWGEGLSLNNLGALAADKGDVDRAQALYEASLRIEEELGGGWIGAVVECNLADILRERGEGERAIEMYERSLRLRRELGDRLGIAHCLAGIAAASVDRGEYERAERLYVESLEQYRAAGARWGEAHYLEGLAAIALARGEPERGITHYAAASAVRQTIGHPLSESERATQAVHLAAAREAIGGEAYSAAWQTGLDAPLRSPGCAPRFCRRGAPAGRRGDPPQHVGS